jgi:NAD+ kinase
MKSILCHADPNNPEGCRAAAAVVGRLREGGFQVVEGLEAHGGSQFDLVLLFGGDGFLMECLHRLDFPGTPVFGVNFGSVGFLMNPRECLSELGEMVKGWRFREEVHPVLEARLSLGDGTESVVRAFNDFVIERQSGQSLRLQVHLDGIFFNRYAGDGFVLSTAAGSTAYNLAAGGPVLHPDLRAMVITPLYPHRAAPFHSLQFPLLVPLGCRVRMEADDLPKRGMRLLADGRAHDRIASITVSDCGRKVRLLRAPDHVFFQTLSRKFIGE